jgi:hypothetical protein
MTGRAPTSLGAGATREACPAHGQFPAISVPGSLPNVKKETFHFVNGGSRRASLAFSASHAATSQASQRSQLPSQRLRREDLGPPRRRQGRLLSPSRGHRCKCLSLVFEDLGLHCGGVLIGEARHRPAVHKVFLLWIGAAAPAFSHALAITTAQRQKRCSGASGHRALGRSTLT